MWLRKKSSFHIWVSNLCPTVRKTYTHFEKTNFLLYVCMTSVLLLNVVGKRIFRESLELGHMECYFGLAAQFRTQDEPAYCGLSTLVMVLNSLEVRPLYFRDQIVVNVPVHGFCKKIEKISNISQTKKCITKNINSLGNALEIFFFYLFFFFFFKFFFKIFCFFFFAKKPSTGTFTTNRQTNKQTDTTKLTYCRGPP